MTVLEEWKTFTEINTDKLWYGFDPYLNVSEWQP